MEGGLSAGANAELQAALTRMRERADARREVEALEPHTIAIARG